MLYEELFARSSCCNCRQEIEGLGVECAECTNTSGCGFRFCGECFSVGAELGPHISTHRYRFFDSGSLALFPASAAELNNSKENNCNLNRWSAREEIRLLDAIEQYGFGNWQDIGKHVESRSAVDSKKEFVDRYVTGSIGSLSWSHDEFHKHIGLFPQPIDHTSPCDDGPLSPSLTVRLPPLDISSDEMVQLGYMPFRDDYEKEYDNDAEKLVSQLTFTTEDDEVDVGLKLALVDMYSRRLRERSRRKRVIRDYQLVGKFFKNNIEKKDVPRRLIGFERTTTEKLRPFAQFYNSREFNHMIQNLVKEKDLKFRLQELYKYRSAGITTADECLEYEQSGRRLVIEEDEGRSHHKLMNRVKMKEMGEEEMGVGVGVEVVGKKEEDEENSAACVNPNLTQLQFFKDDCNLKNSELKESEVVSLVDRTMLSVGGDSLKLNGKQRGWEELYTVEYLFGGDLLTGEEMEICKTVNILPSQFLTIKLAFVMGRLSQLKPPPEIQNNEWIQLINYFSPKD